MRRAAAARRCLLFWQNLDGQLPPPCPPASYAPGKKFEVCGLYLFFFSFCSEYKAVSEVMDKIKGVASEAIVKQVAAIYLFDVKGM